MAIVHGIYDVIGEGFMGLVMDALSLVLLCWLVPLVAHLRPEDATVSDDNVFVSSHLGKWLARAESANYPFGRLYACGLAAIVLALFFSSSQKEALVWAEYQPTATSPTLPGATQPSRQSEEQSERVCPQCDGTGVVSVDMPATHQCPTCAGRGWWRTAVGNSGTYVCQHCNGTGVVSERVPVACRCPMCGGTGRCRD